MAGRLHYGVALAIIFCHKTSEHIILKLIILQNTLRSIEAYTVKRILTFLALCEMHKLEICDAGVMFMPTFSSQITLKLFVHV